MGQQPASPLTPEQSSYFRDRLRDARAVLLKDAEAYEPVVIAMERIGYLVAGPQPGLHRYKAALSDLARRSPLAADLPDKHPLFHHSFEALFELMRDARNAAIHEGAFARHLSSRVLELSLIVEDALMTDCSVIGEYMVRVPLCAEPWQPLSFVRELMLANSFSHLPIFCDGSDRSGWFVVSDHALAGYLRAAASPADRKQRLAEQLVDAIEHGGIKLNEAFRCAPDTPVSKVLGSCRTGPVLVTDPASGRLLGIATAFDLL